MRWIRKGNLTIDEIAKILYLRKADIDNFLIDEAYKELSCIEIE